jgi:lipopolysaccharide/colanic/teichoic acid biosynthesis glycosyltransferase
VSGRQQTTFDDRIRLDLWYIDHWSFWLDLEILARTVGEVLRGRGAY